jgi:hypothetical protein
MQVDIELTDDEADMAETAFSGHACQASWRDALDDQANRMAERFMIAGLRRTYTGTSGAMRWPWSQEDPIYVGYDRYL